jgi:LruC domain-containing protein
VGTQSYPWAIDIPATFSYPIEQSIISSAYLKLDQWISSNGANFSDWYSNTNAGYRNNAQIY